MIILETKTKTQIEWGVLKKKRKKKEKNNLKEETKAKYESWKFADEISSSITKSFFILCPNEKLK